MNANHFFEGQNVNHLWGWIIQKEQQRQTAFTSAGAEVGQVTVVMLFKRRLVRGGSRPQKLQKPLVFHAQEAFTPSGGRNCGGGVYFWLLAHSAQCLMGMHMSLWFDLYMNACVRVCSHT